jgi:hypothetical protein
MRQVYVFPFSDFLCYSAIVLRDRTKTSEKEGAENAERVLRKLLSPRGQMTKANHPGIYTALKKEGAENAEGIL